ncbi:2-polyprenyl-6-methoxyphenol hydroxylase-like FAD-dependent oxidoreductase [Nocardia mexicana]|uniref:2-polyprenyl-6-methoxyphenol hydroxylase-like FAD-dependent oxidoreductase n=2 Tax=Nocardia mexicana TaxID=279262 RepID=A0A370H577_9NOCA|nr:2-polyprenyl-6-methoxyphenol hydroxylase-like FAD-dependent oxidoreductase [Nocardia mexicana]
MPGKAIVIGAGIGGLTAAHGLRRTGWQVEMFDRAADIGGFGSGLSIAPNAMRALRDLGLDAAVDRIGQRLDGLEARLRSGRRVLHIESPHLAAQYGTGLYGVHRGELHRLLRDSLDDVALHPDRRAIGVVRDGSRATVTLDAPGGPLAVHADLVVVADGVHSRLRAALFPGHPGPRYAGYVAWRGIVPADAGLDVAPTLTETWGDGVRIGVMPLRDRRIYWYAFETAPENATPAAEVRDLLARSAPWPGPIRAVLAATPPDAVLVHPVHYLATALPAFGLGPIALLGDAAHAVTPDIGQGACLAIEDAAVLAATVAEHGVAVGIRAYDAARRPRTQSIARASGRIGRALQGNSPAAARVRDIAARLTPPGANARFSDSLYGWTPPTETRLLGTVAGG